MKTEKFAFVLIALMLGTIPLFAQGWRNVDRPGYGYGPGTCLTLLSDLTEDQKAKITELETAHQEAMAELRVKQRSTFEPIEKNEIRGEMLKRVQAHRDEVKNLLTEEQQKQYDLLHARAAYGRRGGFAAPGCRPGRGQAGYGGRGGRGYRRGW
jgi:Spy/CpxP family protein refolding chaperone